MTSPVFAKGFSFACVVRQRPNGRKIAVKTPKNP